MAGKVLNLGTRERHETVALEKIKDTLSQEIGHNANVIAIVKTVAQVNAFIPVGLVVRGQGGQDSQFDPRRIAVFLDGADDFDCTAIPALFIVGFHHFSERPLSQ